MASQQRLDGFKLDAVMSIGLPIIAGLIEGILYGGLGVSGPSTNVGLDFNPTHRLGRSISFVHPPFVCHDPAIIFSLSRGRDGLEMIQSNFLHKQ